MRIIVLSDSHGNYPALESVIMRNTDADWIFHLGDGERELDRFVLSHEILAPKIIHVAGNCDFRSLSPEVFTLPALDHKILAAHGHQLGVKGSLERIKSLARQNGCDIVLYGHTHCRFCSFEDGLYIMNPGSCSCPRDGSKPSFGHIDISPAGVVTNIADV
ncbi:MAG: metallophosphoesterase [Ruminococcus sp.]|nr:metallophosphoesterase [Ruminococcus sp.]